jgi:hypothetical protein
MLDVLKHVEWISKRSKVIVHLVKPGLVVNNFLKKHRAKWSLPIYKTATRSSPNINLPITNHTKTEIQGVDLGHFNFVKNIISD